MTISLELTYRCALFPLLLLLYSILGCNNCPSSEPKHDREILSALSDLKNEDPLIRCHAVEVLGDIAVGHNEVVPDIVLLFGDSDWRVREAAACSLSCFQNLTKSSIQQLALLLKDEIPAVRCVAASSLGDIGKDASEFIPILIDAFNDKDAAIRSNAVYAIGDIGSKNTKVIMAVSNLFLRDTDYDVRESAAVTLGKIGKRSPLAKESLSDILSIEPRNIEEHSLHVVSVVALRIIDSENEAVKIMFKNIVNENKWSARIMVIERLLDFWQNIDFNLLESMIKNEKPLIIEMMDRFSKEITRRNNHKMRQVLLKIINIARKSDDNEVRESAERAFINIYDVK